MRDCPGAGMQNFPDNTLYERDNLDVLRGMNSETVDLIATDPPFNTSRNRAGTAGFYVDRWKWGDTGVSPDQWKWNEVHQVWLEQIKDNNRVLYDVIDVARQCNDEETAAFLCFLSVRLLEMHRILKPTGTLYLHCDHEVNYYIRQVLNAIFGAKQFRSEIIWRRHAHSHSLGARQWPAVHDTLLMYSKGKEWTFNPQYEPYTKEYISRSFRHYDERGYYQAYPITGARPGGDESYQPWRGIRPPNNRAWALPRYGLLPAWLGLPREGEWRKLSIHQKLDVLDGWSMIHWPQKPGGKPALKRYIQDSPGKIMEGFWTDVGVRVGDKNITGSPDQKPLALYERIVLASSNPGDLVLDPFAGCMTTIIAARKHGRRWVGIDRRPDARFHAVCRLMGLKAADVNKLAEGQSDWSLWLTEQLAKFDSHYRTEAPARTDEGETAPHWPAVYVYSDRSILTHREMKQILVEQFLLQCWGCDYTAPDERYLELDHIDPRSQGGENHLPNRALLCGPCNRTKGDRLTLEALRRANRAAGYLKVKRHPIDVRRARGWCRGKLEEVRRERGRG